MLIDLLSHYDAILPPTIAKKKRESDRRVPLRKRTAPIDMRMSRSRLSFGADTQEILTAQLLARNPNARGPSRTSSPVPHDHSRTPPPVPSLGKVVIAPATSLASPPITEEMPSVSESEKTSAPAINTIPAAMNGHDTTPPRPSFAEPPAETEHDPLPMPKFAEPPAETDDESIPMPKFAEPPAETDEGLIPMPKFAEPPAEADEGSVPMPKFANPPPEIDEILADAPSAPVVISPPTPRQTPPVSALGRATSPSRRSPTPSSPTPPGEDRGTSLSRSSSGEASRLRGPRTAAARGPRPPSTVAERVAGLNRSPSGSRAARSPPNPNDYIPKKKTVGRASAGAFSRRTMASDAEDDVVEK